MARLEEVFSPAIVAAKRSVCGEGRFRGGEAHEHRIPRPSGPCRGTNDFPCPGTSGRRWNRYETGARRWARRGWSPQRWRTAAADSASYADVARVECERGGVVPRIAAILVGRWEKARSTTHATWTIRTPEVSARSLRRRGSFWQLGPGTQQHRARAVQAGEWGRPCR
jgi:hypothetical protein